VQVASVERRNSRRSGCRLASILQGSSIPLDRCRLTFDRGISTLEVRALLVALAPPELFGVVVTRGRLLVSGCGVTVDTNELAGGSTR
jgi:hypothetical protein